MEIPDKVLDTLLGSMSCSQLEEDLLPELEPELEPKIEQKTRGKPARRFKSNPTILNTVTALYSKDGKHRALVQTIFDDEGNGFNFRVDATKRTFISHRVAINHARRWLKKKRIKYYKKHPKRKPRIKTVRLYPKKIPSKIKTIQKLYKMERDAAKILIRMSNKKLILHRNYSKKKFNSKKTIAVSGDTKDFNVAIFNVMKDGTKNERKLVAKMLKKFTHEPYRKTNLFY